MTVSRRTVLRVLGAGAAGVAAAGAVPARARERARLAPDARGLLYDSTLCIGCRACVTRCKQANDLPPDATPMMGATYDAPADLNATTKTVIQLYQEGGTSAFVKRQCMQCVDPACVTACMIHAFQKGPQGVITYDKSRCIGCRYCQIACPFNVPKFEWAKVFPKIVKCELCRHREEGPACSEVCPRGAVIHGQTSSLLAEAKRRIAAAPAKYNPKVYGETDAGGTQCLYLAAAGIAFEKLGLPDLGPEPVPEKAVRLQHGLYQGMIAPAVLYAALGAVVWRNRKKGEQGKEGGR
ncbi:MAG TPA: hydrogenase 2 operon protein HybA [Anaeromyxobacteraceae bacterium]|nr:hydrogenase 2 operon protein HybA [Anaeromyxobacteraceae bacterium]